MFYSEILRIIEAGLDRDKDKVKNYAVLLAKKLADDGDVKSSKRIETLLARKNNGSAITDALVAPPVDQESRMGIVDIDYSPVQPEIVLSPAIKARLTDFEDTIKIKDKLDSMGMPFNMSLLLYGPPGCGKTFIAEKFAEQAAYNYNYVKSSDLASTYLHGVQEKIAALFDEARKNAPTILCFDEFDALVPCRDDVNNAGQSAEVNEFLSQMNNCAQRGIFIVATSNRPDKIDPAVRRTGRLDKNVYVPLPDKEARREMFSMYLKKRPVCSEIDIDRLAELTEGYIASDIAYIVNDAAMLAAYAREPITEEHLMTSLSNTSPSLKKEVMESYVRIRESMEDSNRKNNIRVVVSGL